MSDEILQVVQKRLDDLISDTDEIIKDGVGRGIVDVYLEILQLHVKFLKDVRTDLQEPEPPPMCCYCWLPIEGQIATLDGRVMHEECYIKQYGV